MKHTLEQHPGHGLTLQVHRYHDPAARPRSMTLILLHGIMDAGGTWDLVASGLAAEGFEVLAPDQRGFGLSDRVGQGGYYHFPDYVADLRALLTHLAPERVALVGHSMGGTVACLYAGLYPDQVQRLVVMEGIGPPSLGPEAALIRARQWLVDLGRAKREKPLASEDDALRRLAFHHPLVPEPVLESRVTHLTTRREGELWWSFDPLHRSTSPLPFNEDNFKAFLSEIRCPTLYIDGGPRGYRPPEEASRLAAFAGPVSRLSLAEAGHMMHWTQPEEVTRALLDFLPRRDSEPQGS